MKIPYRIPVDRVTYRVVYGDPTKANGGGSKLDGLCDWGEAKLITLDASLRTDLRERDRTFWHELSHGISHEYQVGLNETQATMLGIALANLAEDTGMVFTRLEGRPLDRDERVRDAAKRRKGRGASRCNRGGSRDRKDGRG